MAENREQEELDAMKTRVIAVLKEHESKTELKPFSLHTNELVITRTDALKRGLMNYLALVTAPNGYKLIAKYVPTSTVAYGEACAVSASRAAIEYDCLGRFNRICPGLTPHPICYSPKHNTILMENLDGYCSVLNPQTLKEGILNKMAIQLAVIHSKTHRDHLSEDEFNKMKQQLIERDAVYRTVLDPVNLYNYITNPPDEAARRLKTKICHLMDGVFLKASKRCLSNFFEVKESLIHGDTFLSNILTNGQEMKLVDLEWAGVGMCSTDVATTVGHLLCFHITNVLSQTDKNIWSGQHIPQLCCAFVNTYMSHREWGPKHEEKKTVFIVEVAEYCGFEILQQIFGGTYKSLTEVLVVCAVAAHRLLSCYEQICSIEQLVDIFIQGI